MKVVQKKLTFERSKIANKQSKQTTQIFFGKKVNNPIFLSEKDSASKNEVISKAIICGHFWRDPFDNYGGQIGIVKKFSRFTMIYVK